jgi:hypothetical protein
MTKCKRCGKIIPKDWAEVCWYCNGPLCFDCWEVYGHCGHPEADAINERVRAALERYKDGADD